jgi:hypothetical protein
VLFVTRGLRRLPVARGHGWKEGLEGEIVAILKGSVRGKGVTFVMAMPLSLLLLLVERVPNFTLIIYVCTHLPKSTVVQQTLFSRARRGERLGRIIVAPLSPGAQTHNHY